MDRLLGLLVLLLVSGCMRPYLKVNPSVDAQNPIPALMVSSSVWVVPRGNSQESIIQSVADASIQASMNLTLDEFGKQVKETTGPVLQQQGFSMQVDPERAKAVRKRDWSGTANALTVLSGAWSDPDGLLFALSPRTLFRHKTQAKLGEALGRGQPEAFVFQTVNIYRKGFLVRYPLVEVQMLVMDPTGQDLLLARSKGKGKGQIFICDRDPENLQIGLTDALDTLGALEPEVLIPKEPK